MLQVLIFSTLVMTLDLVEEMLIFRNHKYRRIDGSHSIEERGDSINEFNNNPEILAFLLSTRAGGLGLNLTGADTCIFFDRDWVCIFKAYFDKNLFVFSIRCRILKRIFRQKLVATV